MFNLNTFVYNGPKQLSRLLSAVIKLLQVVNRLQEGSLFSADLKQVSLDVSKLVLSVPLSPDHWRSEVLAQVPQDDHVVSLGVSLEDADTGQEVSGVVGL